jgi:hypothetical protein
MKSCRQVIGCALAGVLAVLLSGCGGRHAIEGTVTLDDAPVDGGMIQFFAQGNDASGKQNAHADIKDGKYSIPASQGLSPGTYKVVITWPKKTGKMVDVAGDQGNKIEETKEAIPSRYNSASNEMREITTGTNRIDYAIKSVKESGKSARDRNN